MASRSKARLFYGMALLVVVLDQVTKAVARAMLGDSDVVTIIPGFLRLRLTMNTGAAFGMLPNWAPLFMVVTLVAIFAIVRLRGNQPQSSTLTAGLGLLMGGAVGNLIDRLTSPSQAVTDFLEFFFFGRPQWYIFNIADAAVVIGAVLLFFHVYIVERGREEPVE